MNQDCCTHSDEERCIFGTWVFDEVRKAIDLGYSLREVFEFWDYKVKFYDKTTNSGGPFARYLNMFLLFKQEAFGYPSWVQSEEDKETYIEDYRRTEGIALDKASLFKHAGQRTLAKLRLNSLWGNFPQNGNKTQTTILTSE
jgi:hypothetical protein